MSQDIDYSNMDATAMHTKRDTVCTPTQIDNPAAITASPKSSITSSGFSRISNVTQTDTLVLSNCTMGTRSATSTPPTSSPTLEPEPSFEFLNLKDMPPGHPSVDASELPAWSHLRPEHAYEQRSFKCPCPAIATMVNHNYLTPKSKCERIPWYKLVNALRDCFNMDLWNALFLTLIATIMCGNWWAVSLKDLQKHNKVEHDASITRHDFNTAKNFRSVDCDRLKLFMEMCKDEKKVSLEDYALRRCQVERELFLEGTRLYRFFKHSWIAFLGRGEVGLTMCVFGGHEDDHPEHGMRVRKDWLQQWFTEERLPADWKRPEKPFTIRDTINVGLALNRRMNAIREDDEQMQWCACPRSSFL